MRNKAMQHIPSIESIKTALAQVDLPTLTRISGESGVPVSTLQKIRLGITTNPGIETVRKFYPLLAAASQKQEPALDGQAVGAIAAEAA